MYKNPDVSYTIKLICSTWLEAEGDEPQGGMRFLSFKYFCFVVSIFFLVTINCNSLA